MPGNAREGHKAGNEGFREAVAQWRLTLRTEVKRASSLPTAMFDACDPMLETRLAETAESMLTRLQQPVAEVRAAEDPNAEKRIERVAPNELKALPLRIAGPAVHLALDADLAAEYLGILTDMCCVATGNPQAGAVHLLQRDFGLSHTTDLAQLTRLLAQRVQSAATAAPDTTADDALTEVCQRVATALVLHLRDGQPGPGAA
ncbi:MAG: hypothetical protein ABIP94_23115 [Planctomycetota bacterium]